MKKHEKSLFVIVFTVFLIFPCFTSGMDIEDEDKKKKITYTIESTLLDFQSSLSLFRGKTPYLAHCREPMRPAAFLARPMPEGGGVRVRKGLQRQIDLDDPRRMKVENVSEWPNGVHGVVSFNFGNAPPEHGTGTLIAPDLVLTAAHNLYDPDKNIEATEVQFIPAINGDFLPFGQPNVKKFYYPKQYSQNKMEDFGLLVLDAPIGLQTGYFGLHIASDDEFTNLEVNVTGYPTDKKENHKYWMYSMKAAVNSIDTNFVSYPIVTNGGNSGGGVYYKKGKNSYYVVAIHALSKCGDNNPKGTRLTEARHQQLMNWAEESAMEEFRNFLVRGEEIANDLDLNLSYKNINNFGVQVLCDHLIMNHLKFLNLSYNNIDSEGIRILAAALTRFPTLKRLDLSGNTIKDEGVQALAENKTLQVLHLKNCSIGNNGAKALARNQTLRELYLSSNSIDDDCLTLFTQNTNLRCLQLFCKEMLFASVKEKFENNNTLERLYVSNNDLIGGFSRNNIQRWFSATASIRR